MAFTIKGQIKAAVAFKGILAIYWPILFKFGMQLTCWQLFSVCFMAFTKKGQTKAAAAFIGISAINLLILFKFGVQIPYGEPRRYYRHGAETKGSDHATSPYFRPRFYIPILTIYYTWAPGVSGRGWFLGQLLETIVSGDDETSHFMLFPDDHEHLGEVQHLGHPGVGQWPGWAPEMPGLDFWANLLKQKLLVMIKLVDSSSFRMAMTIWARSSTSDSQE